MRPDRRERLLWWIAGLLLVLVGVCFFWVRAIGPLPGELRFEAWRNGGGMPYTLAGPLTFVTSFGNPWVAVTTVLVLAAVAAEERGRHPAGLILGAAGIVVFAVMLRAILGPTSQGYGMAPGVKIAMSANFPSVHSAYAVSVFGVACRLAFRCGHRALSYALALPVVLMGPALALRGDHYPADILAGYAIGLAWLIAVLLLGKRWERRHGQLVASSDQADGFRTETAAGGQLRRH